MRKSIATNLSITQQQSNSMRKIIDETIQEMVRIGTEVTRHAQLAIASHIANVFRTNSSLTSLAHITSRRTAFTQYCGYHGNTFYHNLLYDIYAWYDVGPGRGRRRPTPANQLIPVILQCYRAVLAQAQATVPTANVPTLRTTLTTGLVISSRLPEIDSRTKSRHIISVTSLSYCGASVYTAWLARVLKALL